MIKLFKATLAGILLMSAVACTNKTEDVTADFKNSVFVGDSITYGFVVNELLPEERVIGGAGTTAGFVYDDIDSLDKMIVDNVFIMLGSDDLYMPVDDPKELFKNDMTKLISKIKKISPGCTIHLQSIMPVTQEALNYEPRYANIPDYNEVLQDLSRDLSVNYVDIAILAEENPGLFAEDGIHFKKEFYPLWLKKLTEQY